MTSTYQSIRVGLFFIVGLLLVWSLYETLSGNSEFVKNGYTVETVFDDLQQLHIGDEVRLSGIRIGSVSQAYLKGGKAHVKLFIDKEYSIPVDSVATLTTAGLLGNNYISIQAGKSSIPATQGTVLESRPGANINDVIANIGDISQKIETLMGDGKDQGADSPGNLFANLNNLLLDNRQKINEVLTNMDATSTKINQAQGTLGLLINQRDLYDDLVAAIQDVRDLINQAKSGGGVLGVLLYDKTAADELKKAIANVSDFSARLNNPESTLGQLISSDELYTKADDVLNKAETAISTISDAGPLSVVGAVATTLF